MVFRAGDGVTISDTGDSIKVIFEGIGGGGTSSGTVSGIIGGDALSPDDSTAGLITLNVKYDDATIGVNASDALYVKDGSITSTHLIDGTITRDDLSTALQTDMDDAVTLDGNNVSDFAPADGSSGNYIQNQTDEDQSAGFRIDGDALVGGNLGIGITAPSDKLDINGNINLNDNYIINSPTIEGVPTQGLLLYLPFEENSGTLTKDWSGQSNDGTIYDALWTDGIVGKALSFDGDGDYVDLFSDGSALGLTTEATFEFWLKLNTQEGKRVFGYTTSWAQEGQWMFYTGTNGMTFGVKTT